MPQMRLNRFLARAGIVSRRKADDYIRLGLVQVNGQISHELGLRIDPFKDHIRVDGKRVQASRASPIFIMMNKPLHVMVTRRDPQRRPTVYDLLTNAPKALVNVGRLDFGTEGLLL